ncbi:UNVERIFIED_CONTAM: putative late blight resistance protein R1A-10 [Sesamum indicum]
MVIWNEVVSLVLDLDHLLSSDTHFFGRELGRRTLTEELRILDVTLCLLESLLGENRNHGFMNQILENTIKRVIQEAGNYIGFRTLRSRSAFDVRIPFAEVGNSTTFLSPPRRTPIAEGKLVGLEKDLVTMLDNLTGHPLQLKVFPVIGMAGIGKTTFCKKLYDHPLVMHHFYVRAWVTISQQYEVREMLLSILCCVTYISKEIYEKRDEELREQVYRSLKGKRYLIVLDDMWDTEAWDDLKRTFPDDKNGSRVMLTSRLRDIAVHACQDTSPHSMRCLSIHESWELLSSKIFVDEPCPMELLTIGKQIACKCQGLPLAIVVVGGLLSKMDKKLDVWDNVAQSVGSLVLGEADHCQNILALSYNHLPDHLKACFLYMGIFPEDYEISVKKLVWLWVAEGFIRLSMFKSLEEVAGDYLEDLIARSLIMVKRRSANGRIKTCYIHDLMRELCVHESQKEGFFLVIKSSEQLILTNLYDDKQKWTIGTKESAAVDKHLHNLRRLSFHSNILKYINTTSFQLVQSIMYFKKLSLPDPLQYLGMKNFMLLKVLDIMNIHLSIVPSVIADLILLKFMALTIVNDFSMDSFITLRGLQILIIDCEWDGCLARILWDMLELRHFRLKRSCLSNSPIYYTKSASTSVLSLQDAEVRLRVLKNLQTLSTIRPISCTQEVFLSVPNLRKLGIYQTEEDYRFRGWFEQLVHLQELETLKYAFSNPFVSSALKPDRLPSWRSFPPKLVKLTLSGTSLPWEDMVELSMLPKLEVLKLRNYAFSGSVWKSREGGFPRLKFLLIGSTNLEIWDADGTHFPNLQQLVLRHCKFLKEIPYGISEAPLLEKIELHCCKDSAVISARHLQEEQQSLGNDGLKIHISEG